MNEPTEILPCSCEHKAQDEMYGPRMRVHNRMKNGTYKCTVCQAKRDKK